MFRALVLLGLATALALAVTILGGVRHDYIYYLEHWRLVLSGQDPWATNNAYGPLHNAFAPLTLIHPLVPKLITAAGLLLANGLLVLALLRERPSREWRTVYLATFGANALVLASTFWLGLNDGFVAALLIGAVLARHSDRLLLAGLLLGLATLDKYYPALLIPFFAMDARTIQPRLILSALATIGLGLLAASLLWQAEWLEAVTFGVSRDATILSILRPITLLGREVGIGPLVDKLVEFNGPLVVLVWLGGLAAAWVRRDSWLVGATWGLLAVLLTYKVGNQQFWVSWLALVACLPLVRDTAADRLARLSMPYAAFLSLFQFGYVALQPEYYRGPLTWIRDFAATPGFVLAIGMLAVWFAGRAAPASARNDLTLASPLPSRKRSEGSALR